MNFTSFSGHIPAALPTIHQFAAKFGYEGGTATQLVHVQNAGGARYQNVTNMTQFNQQQNTHVIRQTDNVVVSINNATNSVAVIPTMQSTGLPTINQEFSNIPVPYSHITTLNTNDNQHLIKEESIVNENNKSSRDYRHSQQRENVITHQNVTNTVLQMHQTSQAQPVIQTTHSTSHHPQQLVVVLTEPKVKQESRGQDDREARITGGNVPDFISGNLAVPWQSLAAAPGVADYLSLGLQHLLKYTGDKRDDVNNLITAVAANGLNNVVPANTVVVQAPHVNGSTLHQTISHQDRIEDMQNLHVTNTVITAPPKKKKKKPAKEPKPRPKPGEIRLTTALDGSTLYCCPECHMAYPERPLLDQHLLGHTMERKYICDICNAALKRKDHLTRHKQSHNPERPFVCSVCLKAFKRKEQLTLHTVIHTGEKRHVCNECGKGFYRKDHLRKHTRSHIARRVKAELSQSGGTAEINSIP